MTDEVATGRVLRRDQLAIDPVELALSLLGTELESRSEQGTVRVRLVEVEAYRGLDDPASHCYRGRTPRNEVMWGPAGHLYVYFVYGMHFCANVVGLRDGEPGAVLLRAGEVLEGRDLARTRRPTARGGGLVAKGPAVLTSVLGLERAHNGLDLTDPGSPIRLLSGEPVPPECLRSGPRVGVAAAKEVPWRFWVDGSPAVSAYRRNGRARPRS
ncbi:DNA-3-methyladenine glycosylase [Saccharomonospora piscinae]|uniref:Putative 3-methyladenine DNA glycosylase n=1 Tax=Saccharomonospora piscinae TaxID=687388 RepID=A0A1V9A4E9_SACPI|nr:DNA-3-methyladenine glycosylase [Saccharomonospora piscinae]OQO91906.1 DNA-3-methyladenine glycosylase [Saccharomonospora piscinae]TLW92389.1 DNA-3-methyladenine glycosylase [Saccharomonospora piscinae]